MQVNEKKVKYHVDSHHHGLYVREARLRHGYKLDEVADEICTASYLSKIESGRIVPNVKLFAKIVEKLDIEFPPDERKCPLEFFRSAIYQEDTTSLENFLESGMCHHYEAQLIYFFLAVMNEKLVTAQNLKKSIEQYRLHFNKKEEQMFLLFKGLYYMKKFDFIKGEKSLKRSLEMAQSLNIEDPFLYYNLAEYYFKSQNIYNGMTLLLKAIQGFKDVFAKNWVFHCELIWCEKSLKICDTKIILDKLKELRMVIDQQECNPQWNRYFTILGMLYEKKGYYKEAEQHFEKSIQIISGKIEEFSYIEAVSFYYRRQNQKKVLKLIETLYSSKISSRLRLLLDYYYFKASDIIDGRFERFLRKDAIPFAMGSLDYKYAAMFTKDLTSFYRLTLSYKKVADTYYKWEMFRTELGLM